jgi:murein DD-endopeptidase MepM/ murein hydrolase activator NlpD
VRVSASSRRRRTVVAAVAAACLAGVAVSAPATAQDATQSPAVSTPPTATPTATPTTTPTAEPEPVPPPPSPAPVPPPPSPAPAPPPPDADEPVAPPADESTAQEATAPGLTPPPSDLDLTPAVTQATPAPGAVPDNFNKQLEETAAAVEAAQDALVSAEAQLKAAQERLAETEKAREAAEVVRDEAQRAAATAVVAEEQAERALGDRVEALDQQREILGTLAREAYRSGGPLSSLSVVLASTTPEEFAASLRGVEAVLRSEDVVIAGLAAELADLAEAEARLQAAREERERAESVAERALDLATQASETARLVADETEALVDQREAALNAAREAEAAEIERYQLRLAASAAIGSSLVGWGDAISGLGSGTATGSWVRPGYGSLTSSFGPRVDPIRGYVRVHNGADFGPGDGAVYAADDGVVVLAGYNRSYGNMTVVSHGIVGTSAVATLYAHQARILVLPGDEVRKADVIGIVGSTGDSTGPHLHFEIRVGGTPVDPMVWLRSAPTPEEYLDSPQAARDAEARAQREEDAA